jgi:hypothetical protein
LKRVGFLRLKERDEKINGLNFVFTGGLDLEQRALNQALDTERRHRMRGCLASRVFRLRVVRVAALVRVRVLSRAGMRHLGHLAIEEFFEILLEFGNVAAAGFQSFQNRVFTEQRPKHVLQSEILVVAIHGIPNCQVEDCFRFATDHSGFLMAGLLMLTFSCRLHAALQREAFGSRVFLYLRYFRFRDLVRVQACDTLPFLVYLQHNSDRIFSVFMKKALKNLRDELHRGVIVVVQQNGVMLRLLELRQRFRRRDASVLFVLVT